jgi:hypothetical protein
MATFALMHGGFHTSKCWGVFAEELDRRGHQTLTVDFPASDPGAEFASDLLTGRPPIVVPGSHSPFLSRPQDLADLFDGIAQDFANAAA